MLLERTGTSILAVDPGGTTGIALWDAWDQQLYVDQIDAGAGYYAHEWVWPGKVESWARRNAEVKLELEDMMAGIAGSVNRVRAGRGRGKGAVGELAVIDEVETGCMNLIECILLATGPQAFVVWEDFILGWGDETRVKSTARDSVSPIRFQARLADRTRLHGLKNGDAWRTWTGHGWRGADKRGWQVGAAGVPTFQQRLRAVMYWFSTGKVLRVPGLPEDEAVWGGGGDKFVYQMPGSRLWLPGGLPRHVEWLKARGQLLPNRPHGADALLHLHSLGHKMGLDIKSEPKLIWERKVHGPKRVK